jgi:ABC-type phosphonate transport system ATPase subunit
MTQSASDSPPLLMVRGLTKTYGEGEAATHVLKGLDLRLDPGEMAALLGSIRLRQKHAVADFGHLVETDFGLVHNGRLRSL